MIERELKLHAHEDAVIPSLDGVGGLTPSGIRGVVQQSVYWDTPDCRLLVAGFGLRHRGALWTCKGPLIDAQDGVLAREEHTVAAAGNAPPAALVDPLRSVIGGLPLVEQVSIETSRRIVDLHDEHGQRRIEFVDDRVVVLTGVERDLRWREVELELCETTEVDTRSNPNYSGRHHGQEDEALVAVRRHLNRAGIGPEIRVSKHLRALGFDFQPLPRSAAIRRMAAVVALSAVPPRESTASRAGPPSQRVVGLDETHRP